VDAKWFPFVGSHRRTPAKIKGGVVGLIAVNVDNAPPRQGHPMKSLADQPMHTEFLHDWRGQTIGWSFPSKMTFFQIHAHKALRVHAHPRLMGFGRYCAQSA
jgi:hypothetical protein